MPSFENHNFYFVYMNVLISFNEQIAHKSVKMVVPGCQTDQVQEPTMPLSKAVTGHNDHGADHLRPPEEVVSATMTMIDLTTAVWVMAGTEIGPEIEIMAVGGVRTGAETETAIEMIETDIAETKTKAETIGVVVINDATRGHGQEAGIGIVIGVGVRLGGSGMREGRMDQEGVTISLKEGGRGRDRWRSGKGRGGEWINCLAGCLGPFPVFSYSICTSLIQ